jgi:tRNA uridine 5-carbamoylmethylation protein Kti12
MSFQKKILLLGSPASGKTTLAQKLLLLIEKASYFSLDNEVTLLCERYKVTDESIDIAVSNLLKHMVNKHKVIIELPHHNYISLIKSKLLNLSSFDILVTIEAPLDILLERNNNRTYPVPSEYVVRCERAMTELVGHLTDQKFSGWIKLDSELMSIDDEVNSVTHFREV